MDDTRNISIPTEIEQAIEADLDQRNLSPVSIGPSEPTLALAGSYDQAYIASARSPNGDRRTVIYEAMRIDAEWRVNFEREIE